MRNAGGLICLRAILASMKKMRNKKILNLLMIKKKKFAKNRVTKSHLKENHIKKGLINIMNLNRSIVLKVKKIIKSKHLNKSKKI